MWFMNFDLWNPNVVNVQRNIEASSGAYSEMDNGDLGSQPVSMHEK